MCNGANQMLKKLKQKIDKFPEIGMLGLMEAGNMFGNNNSKLHCDKCKHRLPFFMFTVKACSVEFGDSYEVRCRHCNHMNKRVRGFVYDKHIQGES